MDDNKINNIEEINIEIKNNKEIKNLNNKKEDNEKNNNNNLLLNKIKQKNDEINELKHRNFEIENYLFNHKDNKYDKEIIKGKEKILELKKENDDLLKNNKMLEGKLLEKERIQHLFETNKKMIKNLKLDNVNLKKELNTKKTNIEKLKKEITESEKNSKNLLNELDNLRFKISDERTKKINEEMNEEDLNIINQKQILITDLEHEILSLKEKYEKLVQENINKDRDYRQGKSNIEDLKIKNEYDYEIYEQQIELLKNNIKLLKKKNDDIEKSNINLIKDKIQQLENKHNSNLILMNEEEKKNKILNNDVEMKKLINLRLKRDILNLKKGNYQQVLIDRKREQVEDEEEIKEEIKKQNLFNPIFI